MTGDGATNRCGRQSVAVAVVLLVALAPLASAPEVMFPDVVPKALLVRSALGVGIALLVWAIATNRSEPADLRDPVLWSLVALTGISVLSGLAGSSPHHSFFGDFERSWGGVQWAYLTLLYAILRTILGDAEWRLFLRITLYVAVAVATFAVLEFAVERIYPSFTGQGTVSTLGNRGFLGGYMMLAAGLAILVANRAASSRRSAAWSGTSVVLFGAVLMLSGGRAALLGAGLGAGAALGFYLLQSIDRWWAVAGRLGAGCAVAAAALGAAWLMSPEALLEIPVVDRIARYDPATGTVAERLEAWEAGLKGFAARLVTGWGPENFALVYDRFADPVVHRINPGRMHFDRAHNVVVGNLTQAGPAGLAAYLALWGSLLATGIGAWKDGRLDATEAAALLAVLVGYFVYLQFWFEDHSTAVLLVTLAAYLRHRRSEAPLFRVERAEGRSLGRSMLWGTACLGIAGLALWINGRSALAAAHMGQANAADGLRTTVQRFEDARQLGVPEQRSVALEYASSMADLGLESGAGLRDSDSLRALYSRGVEGADRALTPVAVRNPLDARVEAARGRLAAGAALVFAGDEIQALARESLESAIEKSPALLEHRHTLASVEALFGNLEGAREVLREALDLYDGYGRTHYLMSQMSGSPGDSAALSRLRRSFWLDYYPEEKTYLRRTVSSLLERGDPGEAESLLSEYVASRYLPDLREHGDPFAAEREEFLRGLAAEVQPAGREDRPYVMTRRDLPFLAMWPRAAVAAGDCDRAELAGRILLNGLSEEQRTASLRPTLSRQIGRLGDRCREEQ